MFSMSVQNISVIGQHLSAELDIFIEQTVLCRMTSDNIIYYKISHFNDYCHILYYL